MGHRKTKIFAMASLVATSLVGLVVSTVAWFRETFDFTPDVISGSVQGSYYAGGDGSSGDPFQIHDPIHLYNLAWLQYFGTYNKFTSNALTSQTYFIVTANLDMTGWTLPPIGTEQYPFLGSFNGNGKAITGLTSTNNFGSGVKTPQKFTGFSSEFPQPEIVGFFGVVGKLPNETYTYTSANNRMVDFTLDGTTVQSRTSRTLIGIAAGYVNGTMNGVKISGEATIDVNNTIASTAVDSTNITEKLSDYGLVGYSAQTKRSGAYSQSISEWYDSTSAIYGGGGQEPTWGGSVNMKSMYARLSSFKSSGATSDLHKRVETIYSDGTSSGESTELVSTGVFTNYRDDANNKGSVCFSQFEGTSSNLLMLTGSQYMKKETTDYRQSTKTLFIRPNTTSGGYINPRISGNVQTANGDNTSNPPASYGWSFSESNATLPTTESGTALLGKLYAEIDGATYYLYFTTVSGTVRTRTTTDPAQASIWTAKCVSNLPRYHVYATYNGATYYLSNTTGPTTTPGSSGNFRFYLFIRETPAVTITTSNVLDDNYDTYFPLNVNDINGASNKNTGYIVSSSDYEGFNYPKNSGVIRLGYHETAEYSADTDTFYSYYNGSEVQAKNVANYHKFDDLKDEFSDLLAEDDSKFYGLHFMNSTIDANKYVTIPAGYINGTTISNYKVPKNCIDFNLLEKGTITFFAGTYYTDANAFFSLHKITRSGSNISSIEEIKKIYKKNDDNSADYLYETSNSVPASTTGYTLVFNTDWITNPSITASRIYYFEIPMNAGEYALGSVAGRDGAYLMYLDIATNGGAGVDVITGYSITTSKSSISYPVGVDFNIINSGNAGGDSMCISIASSKKGIIGFSVSSTNIDISGNVDMTDSSVLSTYSYQGTKYSTVAASGRFTVSGNSPNAMPEATTISERVIYASVLTAGGTSYTIVVVDVLSAPTSTSFTVNGVAKADLSAVTAQVPSFSGTILAAMRTRNTAVVLTRSGDGPEFNTTPTFSPSNRKDVIIELDATGVLVTVSGITDYSIYKNSIANANRMTNGNTYSF